MLKSLPVLMYHYISSWPNPIAVDPDMFEGHLTAMTENGYRGIGLDEAESYLSQGKPLPKGSVLITFDDGFLDNYVYAWPLLAKHGHKGVVFAVTGKIVDEDLPRPTLDDVWSGFVNMEELPQVNTPYRKNRDGLRVRTDLFFSWKEARNMEASGIISVAAHTHSHRSVFTGPDFSRIYTPGVRRRTFDRVDADITFGLPQFPAGAAMANKAFMPSPKLYELTRELVPQEYSAGARFFNDTAKEQEILKRMKEVPELELGRLETQQEYEARLRRELSQSRDILTRELRRQPTSLAWPWGEYAPEALEIAKELGFTTFFTTALGPNIAGQADAVHRFKAKNKKAKWMLSRLGIYSSPLKSKVYAKLHR